MVISVFVLERKKGRKRKKERNSKAKEDMKTKSKRRDKESFETRHELFKVMLVQIWVSETLKSTELDQWRSWTPCSWMFRTTLAQQAIT